MSLIRKHGAVLQAWACLDLVFSMSTIAHELLHLAWWNFAWTCTETTSRTLL